jgi:hypothetical protein
VRRRVGLIAAAVVVTCASYIALRRPYPPDTTPEGAYVRIAQALEEDRVPDMFAYLETEAQWACFTLSDLRKKALDRVRASYPDSERDALVRAYEPDASAAGGPELFARVAKQRGWPARVRRDLSGAARVDVEGERASVVTARGTRYSFRRRENGIWGLTMFTAELQADAERAARDLAMVNAAADDYDRAKPR